MPCARGSPVIVAGLVLLAALSDRAGPRRRALRARSRAQQVEGDPGFGVRPARSRLPHRVVRRPHARRAARAEALDRHRAALPRVRRAGHGLDRLDQRRRPLRAAPGVALPRGPGPGARAPVPGPGPVPGGRSGGRLPAHAPGTRTTSCWSPAPCCRRWTWRAARPQGQIFEDVGTFFADPHGAYSRWNLALSGALGCEVPLAGHVRW